LRHIDFAQFTRSVDRIKDCFCWFICLPKKSIISAVKILELNHVAIHVADMERSCAFYRDVLRLEMLPRPAFDFPGAWFRLGVNQELHLIGRAGPVVMPQRNNHFALRVEDLAAWGRHLLQAGAEFQPRNQRPDGAWQIFLRDPDGHFLELFTF
jgi:catechol 2,3-dioxygenase-like lactoylglutathione lyase family enzyme